MSASELVDDASGASENADTNPSAPYVSVVMTTYNGARFVAEQIQSVLQQTFANFELIIADDCSNDGTDAILHACAQQDSRIRVVINPQNLGVHRNLEQALTLARGRFIAIADQDDIWESHKLDCLLRHIGHHSAVYSDSMLINEHGHPLGMTLLQRIRIHNPATGNLAIALLRKNCISGHTLLFRHELLDIALPFDARLMFDQQLGFFAACIGGLVFVNQTLVRHRIHGMNQTNGRLGGRGQLGDRNKQRKSELARNRTRRADLIAKLEYCEDRLRKITPEQVASPIVRQTRDSLNRLAYHMRRFDNSFFDMRLFFFLWHARREVFYESEKRSFLLCLKYARGARFFETVQAIF